MSLTPESFDFIADLVRRRSAIQLGGKEYLVESRLQPLARAAGLGVEEYVRLLREGRRASDLQLVVEALTTNETSWFRDGTPFTALTDHVLPTLADERGGRLDRLRIWSAACSTGQEPYSIAMSLLDTQVGQEVPLHILGTDLSEQVLERARVGTYSQLEVNRGLPASMLVRHFTREGTSWRVSPELQALTTFTRHNLLDAPPLGGPFDVVFLRNVLIYFDLPTKAAILTRVRSVLRPGGFLFLGAAETTVGVDAGWERVPLARGAIYRPMRLPAIPTQGAAATSPALSTSGHQPGPGRN